MRWISRLTTVAVLVVIVAALGVLLRSKAPSAKVAGTFKTYAKFHDASRIAVGSPVVIAGVQVGLIRALIVEGPLARVEMEVQDGLELPIDSFATRRADSLFGDSYVEIIPVGGEPGGPPSRLLRSGEPILHVIEGNSTDALLRGIETSLPQIDNTVDQVHDRVIQGRRWVSGPFDDKLLDATDWLGQNKIETPLEGLDRAMIRVENATTRAASRLTGSSPTVNRKLDQLNRTITDARAKMNDTRVGVANALDDARGGIDRIDPAIDDAAEIVASISDSQGQDWKGTLGRLVNDPTLGDTLYDVSESGRDATASFNRFKSFLGMRFEYNVFSAQVRFYATAEIQARNDKFYLIEAERGPLGAVPNDQLADAIGTNAFTRSQEIQDKPRFTLQFGKRFGDLALRIGVKDSTAGAGADLFLFDTRLKLSADIYGSFDPTPRLKLSGAFRIFRTIYAIAGVDDALNTPGYLPIITGNPSPGVPKVFDQVRYGRDYFLGATLSFTDADLSVLLRVYGALLVGLITG
ncbi:MAG TPA: MlaD family protein [Kofleriaceae bacterium]